MKSGVQTSEFWLTLAVAAAKGAFPDLPDEAVFVVMTYVISRTGLKGFSPRSGAKSE